jgi:hypothetical protein
MRSRELARMEVEVVSDSIIQEEGPRRRSLLGRG